MNRACRLVTPVCVALLAFVISNVSPAAEESGVHFRPIQEGVNEARNSNKPMLLFFTAAWCEPCQQLKQGVFSSASVAKLVEQKFVPIEVVDRRREAGANTPEIQALMESMSVTTFPTLIAYRVDGNASVRTVGYSSAPNTIMFLRRASAQLAKAEERAARANEK